MKYAVWIILAATPALADTRQYDEALEKAKEAALIQTGIQGKIDWTKSRLEAYGIAQAERLGIATPLGVVLYCGKVYRDKAVSLPLSRDTLLTVHTDRAAIKINF